MDAVLVLGRRDSFLHQPLEQRLDNFEVQAEEPGRFDSQDFLLFSQEAQEEFVAVIRLAAVRLGPKRAQLETTAICR